MHRLVDGAVGGGNAAGADAEASSSCSSSSSGSSNLDPERASNAKRFIYPPRRPGFQRLGFHEMSELRELGRAAQRESAAGTLTTADASSKMTEVPGLGMGPQAGDVAVRQFNWHMNHRFKGVLIATPGDGVFANWRNLMSARWRLEKHDLANVLKPGSVLRHRWSLHGTLRVSHDYVVFPLYYPNLLLPVNYGGAGRLIAVGILRDVFHDPLLNKSSLHHLLQLPMPNLSESPTDESPSELSPHHVHAKAVMAVLVGYRLGILRHPSDKSLKESSLAQDRLWLLRALLWR